MLQEEQRKFTEDIESIFALNLNAGEIDLNIKLIECYLIENGYKYYGNHFAEFSEKLIDCPTSNEREKVIDKYFGSNFEATDYNINEHFEDFEKANYHKLNEHE